MAYPFAKSSDTTITMSHPIHSEKIGLPADPSFNRFPHRVHRIILGVTHKVLFAYNQHYYVYCMLSKTYDKITFELGQRVPPEIYEKVRLSGLYQSYFFVQMQTVGAIDSIKTTPDGKYVMVFYKKNIALLYYDGERKVYRFSCVVEVTIDYHHYLTYENAHYVINIVQWINEENKLIKLHLNENEIRKNELISLAQSATCEVFHSYDGKYQLRQRCQDNKFKLSIFDKVNNREKDVGDVAKIILKNFIVKIDGFLWFEKVTLFYYGFNNGFIMSFGGSGKDIDKIAALPQGSYCLLLYKKSAVWIFNLYTKKIDKIFLSGVVDCCFITDELIALIDENNQWYFYNLPTDELPIERFLAEHYGLAEKSSTALWLDMLEWTDFATPISRSAATYRFDHNFPGYARGMQNAFSLVEKYIEQGKPLTFARMMKLHQNLMGYVWQNNMRCGFTHSKRGVEYQFDQMLLPLTMDVYKELVSHLHSSLSIDGEIIYKSPKTLTFEVGVNTHLKTIEIFGIDPRAYDDKEALRTSMAALIDRWLSKVQRGKTDEETIASIVEFIRSYHPFHIVEDGSGRLAILVLYYLLRYFTLSPCLLHGGPVMTSLCRSSLKQHIIEGQKRFAKFCRGESLQTEIEQMTKVMQQPSGLFEVRPTPEGVMYPAELYIHRAAKIKREYMLKSSKSAMPAPNKPNVS